MKFMIVILSVLWAMPVQAHSICSHVDLKWIASQVTITPETKIVFKKDRGEICEVVLAVDGGLAPVYAGRDFVVAGRLFQDQINLTRETMAGLSDVADQELEAQKEREALAVEKRKVFFKTRIASLEPLVSMTFGPGNPKGYLYVITDPNCSHCKKLLPLMEAVAFEAKLTLKVIIYPVLGEKSRDMAAHALCNNFTYDLYMEMTGTEALVVCERSDDLLSGTRALLEEAEVTFVPLVVAGDGAWVVEGSDIKAVRTHLGLECDPDAQDGGQGCGPGRKE